MGTAWGFHALLATSKKAGNVEMNGCPWARWSRRGNAADRIAIAFLVLISLTLSHDLAEAAPSVTNVHAAQRGGGSGLVDVYYDLSGAQAPTTVTVRFSADNGLTWTVTPSAGALSGDVGGGVANGSDRHIVWNAGADQPGVHWPQARAFVLAQDASGGLPVEMVDVPATTFTMGRRDDGDDGTYGYSDELPRHQVTLSAYLIGKYEVTNGQMCDVLNWALGRGYLENSSGGAYAGGDVYASGQRLLVVSDLYCQIQYTGSAFTWKSQTGSGGVNYSMGNHPVVDVTWYGCVAFCNYLSEKEGRTPCYNLSTWALTVPYPNGYRLPTEAEWERVAAWDGSKHWIYGFVSDTLTGKNRCNYYDSNPGYVNPLGLTEWPYTSPVGWFNGTNMSPNGSVPTVDSPSPSPVGAYDMSGNVWEWCQDWYHTSYYGAPSDGSSWETQQSGYPYRVLRGGGWRGSSFPDCRSAARGSNPPAPGDWGSDYRHYGFRLSRTQ